MPGPGGFTMLLCLHLRQNNNGSGFACISANTVFYNSTLGFAMLIGHFFDDRAHMLAAAGSLASSKIVPPSSGTFHRRTAVRRASGGRDPDRGRPDLLSLAGLGPVVEHFAMLSGALY